MTEYFELSFGDQGMIWKELGGPPEKKSFKGYAAHPGTGPENETCKSCKFKTYKDEVTRKYIKCELMREHWTGGAGTDIKAGSPACRFWEEL